MATTDVAPRESSGGVGQQAHRQRHEHSGRDGQRFRLAEFKHCSVAQHFPDGRTGLRQEHVPLEHRRTAHLVHDPRQQERLHRPQEGNRFPGGHESRDRARRHHVARPRRFRALRRTAGAAQAAQRSDLLRRSLRQAGRRGLSRGQAAQAGQEHGVRRRRRQPAHHRYGRSRKGHPQAVCQESEGRQSESGRGAGGIRLRQSESAKSAAPSTSSA